MDDLNSFDAAWTKKAEKNVDLSTFIKRLSYTISAVHVILTAVMLFTGFGAVSFMNIISAALYIYCGKISNKEENTVRISRIYIFEIIAFCTVMTLCVKDNCWFAILELSLIPFTGLVKYIVRRTSKENEINFNAYVLFIILSFSLNSFKSLMFADLGIVSISEACKNSIIIICFSVTVLFLAMVSAAFSSHSISAQNQQLDKLEDISLGTILSLSNALEAKDHYTDGHSNRVARYAMEISKRMDMDIKSQHLVYNCGRLHDLGKIGILDNIINKEARLDDDEFEQMKQHPIVGDRILARIENMPELHEGARWHHERYDGTGYPDGLSGEDIPLFARIIAVADAYDAMTSDRSYRKTLPQEYARDQLVKGKGKQFDPKIADIMIQIIDEKIEAEKEE